MLSELEQKVCKRVHELEDESVKVLSGVVAMLNYPSKQYNWQ